jgi:hypothetical protein
MLPNELDPAHIAWTDNLYSCLNIGGRWIAPMWPAFCIQRTGERSVHFSGHLDDHNYQIIKAYTLRAGWRIDNLNDWEKP